MTPAEKPKPAANGGAQPAADWALEPTIGTERRWPAEISKGVREVWGDDKPYDLGPLDFVTWDDLRRVVGELHASSAATIIDLGCGTGGVGLWVASQTEGRLIGVDLSEPPLAEARRRAARDFPQVDADFRQADMADTGLPDGSADAIMTIDAVQMATDRQRVFSEAAWLLRPGGRLVAATFDHPNWRPEEIPPGRQLVPDSRPLLEQAGLEVLSYQPLTAWPGRAVAVYELMLEHRALLAGWADAALAEAEWGAAHAHMSRHVFIVAERA